MLPLHASVQIGDLYYNLDETALTAEVTYQEYFSSSNYAELTSTTIPTTITYEGTTYNVTSIGIGAFYGCTGLTSVTIPNSVTSIESCAFLGCTGITSIIIPNSVTSIGSGAFDHCIGLTSITIGNGVTSVGNDAFKGCTELKYLIIPNSVTDIPSGLLKELYALDSISVPATVFDVKEAEWTSQPKTLSYVELNSGEITDNVVAVLQRSYKTLKTLDVSQVSNTAIPDEAFNGYYNLKTLRLPANLTNIPYMAAGECLSINQYSCFRGGDR